MNSFESKKLNQLKGEQALHSFTESKCHNINQIGTMHMKPNPKVKGGNRTNGYF